MRHIENIEMDKVDFNYMQPDDISFFLHCIGHDSSYLTVIRPSCDPRMGHKRHKYQEPSKDRQLKDMTKMFFMLVDSAEKYGFDSEKLIGTCMDAGRTVFGHVTKPVPDHHDGCRKIAEFILSRNIPVNTIETTFITPQFYFADLTEQMMLKVRD